MAASAAVAAAAKSVGTSTMLFGRIYRLANNDNTAVVMTTKKVFNRMLNRFFDEKFTFNATLAKLPAEARTGLKMGDWVTIRELPTPRPRRDISHAVETVEFSAGRVKCPFTGRLVEGDNYLLEIDAKLPKVEPTSTSS